MKSAYALLLFLATGLPVAVMAAAPYLGRPLVEVIDEVRAQGYEITYSSRLVPPAMLVSVEPRSRAPLSALLEILEAVDLTLQGDVGAFLIIRKTTTTPRTGTGSPPDPPPGPRTLETITVSASRYQISRDIAASTYQMDQRSIQTMPDVGEDPIRIVQRLPGAAASGASARTHLRGGEEGEVGIVLNGQRLFDPFHVRDYQSIFSAIDSRAIQGVEVYTGGFPVRFGDRMSGLVLMESLDPEDQRHTELGLSVFNTSALLSGRHDDKRWLLSARRGNLDLVIDDRLGEPSYYDVFGQFAMEIGARSKLSANALYADDEVVVVLESDAAEMEQVQSTTRNVQSWLQVETQWSERLSSRTALSYTNYSNRRLGSIDDREKMIASVRDNRDVRQVGLRQDWNYEPSKSHFVQWGFNFVDSEADYDYAANAEYFGITAIYQGRPASLARTLQATPSGANYALYFADRWAVTPRFVFEWGLRWDDQTYTSLSSDAQLSPRFSVLFYPGTKVELRASWGRYHQSQGVQELQIEDGVTNFWPAQSADHFILGLQYRLNDATTMRLEAFNKDMQEVRPRFENLFNPLAPIPELLPDRVRLDPTSARSLGAELSLDSDRGAWAWWIFYTLSRTTDRLDGRNQARSWDQRHALQGGLSWKNEKWDLAVAAGAHTGWPTTGLALQQSGIDDEGEPRFIAVPGPRNQQRLGTFFSLDVRASRRFDVKRGSLTAFFELVNATNRRNVCCIDWDLAENDAGDEILESSNDYWLPLLPAVGILWEF